MIKIGILEAGRSKPDLLERHGSFPAMFERFLGAADPTFRFCTYAVFDEEFPDTPQDCDAWLITGSRYSVYEQLPWIEQLKTFTAGCYAEAVPVVGICFGHQILAEALGGEVQQSKQGWGLGVHYYDTYIRPVWMSSAPERFAVNAVHQDQIVRLPCDAQVIAGSAFCPYAVIAYPGNAISFQAHPEFSSAFVRDLLQWRRGTGFPEEAVDAALKTLTQPLDSPDIVHWIVNFLQQTTAVSESGFCIDCLD